MYDTGDLVGEILPAAESFLLDNDRGLYKPFILEIEKFCADENVLVGGKVGAGMLIGAPISLDSFMWDLYCGNTYTMAKRLADRLASVRSPHIDTDTVEMETNIRHREFTVRVNTRVIAKIYAIGDYKHLSTDKFIRLILKPGLFSEEKIRVIPDELQIIDIYRVLYSPARSGEWPYALAAEQSLFNGARVGFPKDISGGADSPPISEKKVLKIVKSAGYVIIGDYAIATHIPNTQPSRLQIIVDSPDASQVEESIKRAIGKNANVYAVKHDLLLPNDFQTYKYTVFMRDNRGIAHPIVDVFNSGSFEMIPYREVDGYKYGAPWVILRFMFIDLWVARMLSFAHNNPSTLKSRIRQLAKTLIAVRSVFTKNQIGCFQADDYYGVYTRETVEKKKLIRELGERFAVYYPVLQQKKGGADELTAEEFIGAIHGETVQYKSKPVDTVIAPEIKNLILSAAGYYAANLEDALRLFQADAPLYAGLRRVIDPPAIRPFLRTGKYYSLGIEGLPLRRSADPTGAEIVSLFGALRAADPTRLVAELSRAAPGAIFIVKEYDVFDSTSASVADFARMVAGDERENMAYLAQSDVDVAFARANLRKIWTSPTTIAGEFYAVYGQKT